MLKNRRILYAGVALLLAAVTVAVTQQWLQRETSRLGASALAQAPEAALRILVAGRTLPPGTILQREDLIWQAWPAEGNVESYFAESGSNLEELVGAVVRNGIAQGEPLTRHGVVQPGDRSFLAAVLRPGHRAVSIAVTASTGVSGFIRPGDRVDVILSRVSQGGGSPNVSADTILAGARVVGIDQQVTSGTADVAVPQTATLEVTPSQAEAIAAATELGKLSLSLRSVAASADDAAEGTGVRPFWKEGSRTSARPASVQRSTSQSASPPASPSPPSPTATQARTIEVVRGIDLSVQEIK